MQPATSAWNPARSSGSILETFLASQARALPVALLIGHIFNNSENNKHVYQIKFSNCSLEDADYDDGGDKIVEEESSVKFHLEVPPCQAEPIEDF